MGRRRTSDTSGAPNRSGTREANSSPDFGLHTSFSRASRFRFRFEAKPPPQLSLGLYLNRKRSQQ